ncbi:MAG TPA: hypothetical protein VI844_03545 [Coxiellaceae bacterium]|nr:hypothetical protein [Coxiellaceae bacterium]
MSIFSKTMVKAIGDYRVLLRRHLSQVERMVRLQKFQLRNPNTYKTDLALYKAGQAIIADVRQTMVKPETGYYSYSGLIRFCEHLEIYLSEYLVEGEQVVHRTQKASRALLGAIQVTHLPRERLDEQAARQLCAYNEIVVDFGSEEQCALQLQTLERCQADHPGFYTRIVAHMESLLHGRSAVAA